MKATSRSKIKRAAAALSAIVAVPFLLIGITVWSIVTFGKIALETLFGYARQPRREAKR